MEARIEELEEEIKIERSTNLEMLENLKSLNEKKLVDHLAIKDEEIINLKRENTQLEFLLKDREIADLNRRLRELKTKYSELVVKEN